MMVFLRTNAIIGLVLAGIIYGLLAIICIPELLEDCRDEHISIWKHFNKALKDMYGFKKDKNPVVCMLIFMLALAEAVFLWELHWPFVCWLIARSIKEERKED